MSKAYEPVISPDLQEILVDKYLQLRKEQLMVKHQGDNYTTTRKLLALIRLCQAKVYI